MYIDIINIGIIHYEIIMHLSFSTNLFSETVFEISFKCMLLKKF